MCVVVFVVVRGRAHWRAACSAAGCQGLNRAASEVRSDKAVHTQKFFLRVSVYYGKVKCHEPSNNEYWFFLCSWLIRMFLRSVLYNKIFFAHAGIPSPHRTVITLTLIVRVASQFIKHLGFRGIRNLTQLYSPYCNLAHFPSVWKTSINVVVLKPTKSVQTISFFQKHDSDDFFSVPIISYSSINRPHPSYFSPL